MSTNEQNKTKVDDTQLDDELKMLLDDAGTTTVTVELPAANDDAEIDMERIEAEAHAAEIKGAAYAEQKADKEGETGTVTSIKTAKTPRTPRVSRAAGGKSSSVLASVMAPEALQKVAMLLTGDDADPELVNSLNTSMDGLAKKVGDKAVNLLRYQSEPKKIQGYTRLGLELLIANGTVTSKDLTEYLQKRGYTIGTARSQANQLMALLPALKVADKSARTLTVKPDSTIVANFSAAVATPVAA